MWRLDLALAADYSTLHPLSEASYSATLPIKYSLSVPADLGFLTLRAVFDFDGPRLAKGMLGIADGFFGLKSDLYSIRELSSRGRMVRVVCGGSEALTT